MNSDTAISIKGISKAYTIAHGALKCPTFRDVVMERIRHPFHRPWRETFWALKDVSFDVKKGEVVGIIGRNGAGKSTLLKILSRITEPTAGRIELYGRVGSLLEVGTGFHPELTGRENVFLNGAILGMSRAEIRKQFDAIVAFAEVEQFLDTPVKRYSSGMYVRLAFAVSAHLNPEILIVDEVLAVGDAQFQKKCLGKMGEVAKGGRTVLFVSHNMPAVVALCSRVVLIREGQLTREGVSQDVVRDYLEALHATSSVVPVGERQDRLGDGSIRVVDFRCGTRSIRGGGFWRTGEDAFAELAYRCLPHRTFRNVEVALGIRKLDQTPLLYLGTKVVRYVIDSIHGSGSFVCEIKRLPLEPGRYSITAEIQQNGILVDLVRSAANVDVAEGDYYGTGVIWPYGGFLCQYSWSHNPGEGDDSCR